MAIKLDENKNEKNTAAAAPAGKTAKVAAPRAVSAEEAKGAEVTIENINPEELGKLSDTLHFVETVGDATREDRSKRDGKEIITPRAVGYRFKTDVDLIVPDCGIGADGVNNPMSFVDKDGTREVKAGETFDLTRFETAVLLSRVEFNSAIADGFTLQYGQTGTKTQSNTVATTANSLPTVFLKAPAGSDSLKERAYASAIVWDKSEDGTSKTRKVEEGFEKFGVYAQSNRRKSKVAAAGAVDKTERNKRAAAFLDSIKGL